MCRSLDDVVTPGDYKRLQWGRLLVWLPEFLYRIFFPEGKPPCKWCGWSRCVVANDFLNPAGPRLVLDKDSIFFIWCGTYECATRRDARQLPYHFNGYGADSLKFLPHHIRSKFPALLTRRSAISVNVINEMVSLVMRRVSFSSVRTHLRELHLSKLAELEANYVADVRCRLKQVGGGCCSLLSFGHDFDTCLDRHRQPTTAPRAHRLPSWPLSVEDNRKRHSLGPTTSTDVPARSAAASHRPRG